MEQNASYVWNVSKKKKKRHYNIKYKETLVIYKIEKEQTNYE